MMFELIGDYAIIMLDIGVENPQYIRVLAERFQHDLVIREDVFRIS